MVRHILQFASLSAPHRDVHRCCFETIGLRIFQHLMLENPSFLTDEVDDGPMISFRGEMAYLG